MITVKDLTTEEKLRLLSGKDFWHTVDFDGKIPYISVSDGPVGLRKVVKRNEDSSEESMPAVGYPNLATLANSWSRETASLYGSILAEDCLENDVDILLAPGVNIKRHPLNGRNFEYLSEDPYLAGTLAYEYIDGVQKRGVGTCLKHFVANNLEFDRRHQSSEIDERTLREIYYKPFEIAVKAKPVSIMCAYNRINGIYASENKKGFDVLRKEFGFDGAIISDWYAVRSRSASANAGLDLEMPFDEKTYEQMVKDYKDGKISDEVIDECAARVLSLIDKCKAMRKGKKPEKTLEDKKAVALKIEEEGAVLLKNDDALPIKKEERVAVFGAYARPGALNTALLAGGGSAFVNWIEKDFDIPRELENILGDKVYYEPMFINGEVDSFNQDCREAVINANLADVSVVCVGTGKKYEYEGADRETLRLPKVQEDMINEIARASKKTVVVIFAGSSVDVSPFIENVDAILYAGFCGMEGDVAIANILTGKTNPSGKLSETFPIDLDDVPSVNAGYEVGVTRYHEGLDIGYRYFASYNDTEVLYPFGFGLSYSEFEYSNIELKAEKDGSIKVSYDIENVSDIDGKEISEVYVTELSPLVYRPVIELKGYSKDFIKAGEKKRITVILDKDALKYYSTAIDGWKLDDGIFEISVGKNSEELELTKKLSVKDGKIKIIK